MSRRRSLFLMCWASSFIAAAGCKDEPEPEPKQPTLAQSEPCDPNAKPVDGTQAADTDDKAELPPICAPGLACEPVADTGDYVCGTALDIRGRVTDSTTGEAIAGALIAALNENGEPVTDVVVTDACGDYILPVSVRRAPDGTFAETLKWTLNVGAQDFLPFPSGFRPALPVDMADAAPNPDPPEPEDGEAETDGEVYVSDIIKNAATSVTLIPLPADQQGGSIVSGTIAGEGAAGTLVVAEGKTEERSPYGIADASGGYTLFNVPTAEVTIRGYRRGIEVEPAVVAVSGEAMEGVDLAVTSSDIDALARVSGNLGIVNAPGGSVTSVVLVPSSVYNELLERGPVPIGLRDPEPPLPPDVTSDFAITGVPSGTYKVLVAFENDQLVRDPDEGIAGTAIQEITVGVGEATTVDQSFKVTAALSVVGPGSEGPEAVDPVPTFSWTDDSSEDGYNLIVFNALGDVVWEQDLASVSGSASAEVSYGGSDLAPGMYYQFRVTSYREQTGTKTSISRTEDLRGVFVTGEAPPAEACMVEDPGGSSTGD